MCTFHYKSFSKHPLFSLYSTIPPINLIFMQNNVIYENNEFPVIIRGENEWAQSNVCLEFFFVRRTIKDRKGNEMKRKTQLLLLCITLQKNQYTKWRKWKINNFKSTNINGQSFSAEKVYFAPFPKYNKFLLNGVLWFRIPSLVQCLGFESKRCYFFRESFFSFDLTI